MGPKGPALRRRRRGPAGHGLRAVRVRAPEAPAGGGLVEDPTGELDRLLRHESGRAVATLIRVLGDFDRAEEAVQDAYVVALERWPSDGVPENPGAWITRVARNKAIDRLRRERTLAEKTELLARLEADEPAEARTEVAEGREIPDDRLRLIFTCCHPALAPESRVALTLRTLGGLTTAEIARAFLVSESAMAQRLVRAKRKIRDAGIPYEIPSAERLTERLAGVLATLYLIFNEGYLASTDEAPIRGELCAEAIRLAGVLAAMLPREPEVVGLLALMLLHDSRRAARLDADGQIVLLSEQDRSLWDRSELERGLELAGRALASRRPGPYVIQAAISAEHCRAATADDTDWARIRHLYDFLVRLDASPVIRLNRAVALAMEAGPERGLAEIDRIEGLERYHLLHSARADLLARLTRNHEAAAAYRRAIELAPAVAERSLLERRLAEVESRDPARGSA